ncbi:MAG: amidohydrolase [candidate division WOR-3 bacterium]|nr:amidohydrolase [candidate division WOR-3 bacterium]
MIGFINGNILSMEKSNIEALVIKGDRIDRVGPRNIVKEMKQTEIVNLEGRFLIPGFIDSHIHFVDIGLNLARVDLSETESLKDALDITEERLKREKKVAPLICVDFDESKWKERRLPTREELDRLSSKRAVIFRRVCGHIAVVNKKALSSIPEGWKKIDYDSGILLEDVVLYINEVFPPSKEEIEIAIIGAQKKAHSLGITSIHDMGMRSYLDVYREMERKYALKIRVYAVLPIADMNYIIPSNGEWVKTGGIKLFADGSIGARTAALNSPYPGTKNYGILNYETTELDRIVKEANRRGIQIFIHAIGERAIEQVLSVYGKELDNSKRHRIEHFELASNAAIKKAKELDIILAMQPNFIMNWGKKGGMYQEILKERGLQTNRFKTALEEGCILCFGSDSMPAGPIYGLKGAMEHPTENISFKDALKMYTINSAYAGFNEEFTGSIKEGKKADLVVLSGSPPDLKVDMTMANGEVVYNRL